MKTIETYKDLCDEKARLESLLAAQRGLIRQDFAQLKDEFRPATNLFGMVTKIATKDKSNIAVAAGVDFLGDFLLKKFILARSNWLVRLVVPFFLKNYYSHLLNTKVNQKIHESYLPGNENGKGSKILLRLAEKFKKD